MGQTYYVLLFEGEIAGGRDMEEVKRNVAALFRANVAEIEEKLFCDNPKVIKTCPDRRSAEEFKRIFELTGAVCRIEPFQQA